jgi:hypothetical protein
VNTEGTKRAEFPVPSIGFTGAASTQKAVCQEIYDHLVYKKLLKLQAAVGQLNRLIKEIAK